MKAVSPAVPEVWEDMPRARRVAAVAPGVGDGPNPVLSSLAFSLGLLDLIGSHALFLSATTVNGCIEHRHV